MAREWDRVDRKRSRSRSPSRSSKSTRSDRHRDRKHSDRDRKRSRHSTHHRSHSKSESPSPPRLSKRLDPNQPVVSRGSTPERINQEKVEDIIGGDVNYRNFDMDEQQKRLELIMQHRRERVEKWRKQQKEDPASNVVSLDSNLENNIELPPIQQPQQPQQQPEQPKKAWTFDDDNYYEDDDDEDDQVPMEEDDEVEDTFTKVPPPTRITKDDNVEEDKIEEVVKEKTLNKEPTAVSNDNKPNETAEIDPKLNDNKDIVEEKVTQETPTKEPEEEEEVDDVDPLDAYMQGIQEEVKKYRSQTIQANKGNTKVTMVVGVAKKKTGHKRGELMEQNQDALEFSSGDEAVGKEDELANAMDNLQAKAKQKKLLTISKDDITFLAFNKNFYIEVPEITRMTQEEVDAYKIIMEGIKTKGKGCPRPIKTWAQCGVSKRVFDVLKKNNYEKPTPIQCQAIPAIMSGRDLIGIAKTGSGKTLAFLLPMFRHIMDQPPLEPGDGPIAVIMTPTRELATQIYAESRKFAKSLGLRVVAVYGGTPISEQIGDLKPGAEVVVCTPGRMIDMLAANSGRVTNLRRCTYVVLDEADRMFDMGFEPQVMRIIDGIRPDRQTVMFSATFPRIMEALARRILDKPIEVQVGGRSIVCKEVEQQIVVVNEDDKFLKLLQILGKYSTQGSAIAFVDKQEHADMLLKELMHASYTCLALHGGIDQNDRDSTIADFKNGKVNVLVATSVAARGLDVKHCIVVINYDCPNHYEDYVHRCGRTGRAGNKGYAYTFITPEQGRYANDLIKALDLSGNKIPEELQKVFDDFKREQESQGKKVKSSSGFTGKGFKFDEAEAQQAVEKKKLQKAALGLQDSDDEDPEADIDQEIENMLAPKKKTISVQQPIIPVSTAPGTTAQSAPVTTTTTSSMAGEKSLTEKLELAKHLASRISMSKTPSAHNMNNVSSATAQTEAILKGDSYSLGNIASAVNAKSIAEQRAEKLHAKLNYIPKDLEYNENGDIVRRDEESEQFSTQVASTSGQRFEEELEINDFPQQARWRVTSKEAIAMISEYSEAGITVRGTFFPPGKEPKELGERKLYLAIEGTNDISVSKARAEIIRLIKEELVKLSNSYLPFNKNRYKVL